MIHIGSFYSKTDNGKVRLTNEDNVTAQINSNGDVLLMVCDGMGGYKKGDFASKIVIDTFLDAFCNRGKFLNQFTAINWINLTLNKANKIIFKYAQSNEFLDMGTTFCLALIASNNLIISSCGDSRCYIYDKNNIKQITIDDTYVQYLFNMQQISKEEMLTHPKRHVLTNAVGIFPAAKITHHTFKYKNQNILLCSDGLYNNLEEKDIHAILKTKDEIDEKINTLIKCANDNGGSDNIGVVCWESKKHA